MKKRIVWMMVLTLVVSLFCGQAWAEAGTAEDARYVAAVGYLSYLNMSEEEIATRLEAVIPANMYLREKGVLEFTQHLDVDSGIVLYDSLDAMLMGLTSGQVGAISVPSCTARYLCAVNDSVEQVSFYHREKAGEFAAELLSRFSNGYSFLFMGRNGDLRDRFDQAIAEMKADGTMDQLISKYITDAVAREEPEAVAFEKFEGDPIRVAVTGSLPPYDYVSADGTPAGFNTAVLSEIGKRLQINIELVQTDSVGRALALAQGRADAVFWARGLSEGDFDEGTYNMNAEERKAYSQAKAAMHTEEENKIMGILAQTISFERYAYRDRPEGTIITVPYYTDIEVLVVKK